MRRRTLAFAATLAWPVVVPSVALASEGALTVDEAVEMAVHTNPHLLAAEANTRTDRDNELSVRGRMLPSVHVTEEAQHWDRPFGIAFGPTTFIAREQNTNTFAATANQPLLGLLHLSHERSAKERTADATEVEYASLRADLKTAIEVGYLNLFEARAMEEIARASEAELTDESHITKAKVDAGVLTNADLLRVEVAVANAKQQEIVAHANGAVTRAKLLGAIGLSVDSPGVDFAEPKALLERARAALPRTADAERHALAVRPEVKERNLQVEAADHEHRARQFEMLPEVNAEAGYSNIAGQPFLPPNSGFVGVKVDWPIWEWGAAYYAQRAAGEQVKAAEHELDSQRRQVGVEVATGIAEAQAAGSAVEVAQQAIASAEEAFRVTSALLKAGSATTTDLLDSQGALTQARLNLTRAQYEQAISQAKLARALGQ